MNPSTPFGSPQGGAFQAPKNTVKTGLFQSFGQQSSSNQPQTMGILKSSVFGQPSVLNQPSPHGNCQFGQTPAFGQSSTQPTSLPRTRQVFGQQPLGMTSSGFGSSTPAFGQTSGPNQSSVFGQTPSFGQPSAFGQKTRGFGNSQTASGSTTALGPPQPLGFGQSVFGQPSSTSVFGTAQSVTQSRGLGSFKYSFKPVKETLLKPIFSASPEPATPQTTAMSSSPFGSSGSQTSYSTTNGFSLLTGAESGQPGFSFSQPAAAPSISAQNNPPTTANSCDFGQPSTFGDTEAKAETRTEEKGSNLESSGETNAFAQLSKGTKRKEDPAFPSTGPEKPATGEEEEEEEEEVSAEAKFPRHSKRLRGPPGRLFGRALNGLRRGANRVRRKVTKETQPQVPKTEETESEAVRAQSEDLPAAAPTVPALTRDVLEKAEESGPGDKGSRPAAGKEVAEVESQEDTESKTASSPNRRPAVRGPAVSSIMSFSRCVVKLTRIAYQEPELPLSQKKSEVILSKKTMLIGEVVNGGPLPSPVLHTPVCSFDAQNKFRGEGQLTEPTAGTFKAVAAKVEAQTPPCIELLTQVVPGVPFLSPPAITDETGEPNEVYPSLTHLTDTWNLSKELSLSVKQDVIMLKDENKPIREIAKTLGVAISTVWYIVKKKEHTGELSKTKRPGRPQETTVGDDSRILLLVKKKHFITVDQIKNTLQEVDISVLKTTIKRRLQQSKIQTVCRKKPSKKARTVLEKHPMDR